MIVTVARPCSSRVSTIVGSIAALLPSTVEPRLTVASPLCGPPLLNSSDDSVSVTDSPAS